MLTSLEQLKFILKTIENENYREIFSHSEKSFDVFKHYCIIAKELDEVWGANLRMNLMADAKAFGCDGVVSKIQAAVKIHNLKAKLN